MLAGLAKRLPLLLEHGGNFLKLRLRLAKQDVGTIERPFFSHFFNGLTHLGQLPCAKVPRAALERVGRFAEFGGIAGGQRNPDLGQSRRGVLQKKVDQFGHYSGIAEGVQPLDDGVGIA